MHVPASMAIRSNRKAASLSVSRSVASPGSHLARGMFSADFLVCQRVLAPTIELENDANSTRALISRDKDANDVACQTSNL